ncbi:unnamed protein product [Orchesella dallaii]|uniref:Uncharacterized protein n=1 Tax=Orchesella dallaii TaxID=48710 RepID=A0ABP1RWA9_9HEXA
MPKIVRRNITGASKRLIKRIQRRQQRLGEEQSKINARITTLEENIHTYKQECGESSKTLRVDLKAIATTQDKLQEQQDRLKRINNIVIMGIPEDENDHGVLSSVMQVLLPNNTLRIRTHKMRIGKPSQERMRPIRVQLNSNNEAHSALQNAKKLKDIDKFQNIYARLDQTKQQQLERRDKIRKREAEDSGEDESSASRKPANKTHRMDTDSV